jgi:photosystem II stability/assembly factor-like uncharacterized protein
MSSIITYGKQLLRCSLAALLLLALAWSPAISQSIDMSQFQAMKARNIGPAGMSGRITAIDAVNSNPDIIYAGAASGGIWKSTSGGITWKPIFDEERVHSIGAISIYQKNPDIIWVGTGEGNPRNSLNHGYGVYRSLDAGNTWQLMGLENTRNIHRIIVHPDNPDVVFVGASGSPWGEHPERGVYKTTDGGKTWNKILYINEKTGVGEMIMDPNNPNKLFVNMWEHRRWPWFFKSGGPSSGLYVTHDGGENWNRLNESNGLPKGDLGRMGLAIPRINSNRVYALIESSNNALYVSDDGGRNFRMVNDKGEIGDRPFYYYEIHADPKNENRLFTLYSRVAMSEDGGKSFTVILPYSGVHPDHHAWYIHPENPNYMIDGNDGGLNITRDGGKTWYFAEGIPVGQWYHINVDNDIPYNIYGGLQDNGSWYGPAYVWRLDGIRNTYWQEIMFGDGFDVVPDPTDSRYGYSMSQGGNVSRYDRETSHKRNIRPTHPDPEVRLRFNWNAAIAQDPHNTSTVYYGSQFLHKSTDKGDNWVIISPDLTTNDPEKQKQNESGGLTLDATGAENHTTIIAIAPSPVDPNVIYVGTDDGNLQVTRDGGKTWSNTSSRMPGMPKGSWIPQVQASRFNAGEAWVIVNNYRNNDFTPYAYRTKDYGNTWERIADDKKVWGYTLSIVQDLLEPNLVFLGTEYGLYVSFDNAKTWNQWRHGYPRAVSTYDMVIHPREHDLVIGTFGRSIYVLDDIRPLREVARQGVGVFNKPLVAFENPDAYQAVIHQPHGERFGADGKYAGENRAFGGRISFMVNPPASPKEGVKYDSVTVEIFDASNNKIRTLKTKPEKGVNILNWNLDRRSTASMAGFGGGGGGGGGFGAAAGAGRFFEASGGPALPGTYKLVLSYGDQKAESSITVHADPRIPVNTSDLVAKQQFLMKVESAQEALGKALGELNAARTLTERIVSQNNGVNDQNARELIRVSRDIQQKIQKVNEYFNGPQQQGPRAQNTPRVVFTSVSQRLNSARSYASSSFGAPTETELRLLTQAEDAIKEGLELINEFFRTEWPEYRKKVEGTQVNLFKDIPVFKLND